MAKKLAILGSRGIPARYGGFETFAEELSRRLAEKGVDVTVYCESNGKNPLPSSYNGVKLFHMKAPKLGPLSTILFDLKCLYHARKQYNVVYMLGYGASLFCFLPRLFGTRVWINMDGIEWRRSKWSLWARIWLRWMERVALWTSDRIICDAEGIRNHLFSKQSKPRVCSVIPYGAPVVDRSEDRELDDTFSLSPLSYYLIVCRIEPENHTLEIVKGFSESATRRSLVVVGDLNPQSLYSRKILEAADGRVKFIGSVYDKPKLQALRRNAFAYFHGHSVGGTNPSLLESMGCGRPVIAHDNPFNREVAGKVAFFFKNRHDLSGLIERVESLSNDETRNRSSKALEIIKSKYNWDGITEAYLRLLKENEQTTVKNA